MTFSFHNYKYSCWFWTNSDLNLGNALNSLVFIKFSFTFSCYLGGLDVFTKIIDLVLNKSSEILLSPRHLFMSFKFPSESIKNNTT